MSAEENERWIEIKKASASVAFQVELLRAFVRDFPDRYIYHAILGDELSDSACFEEGEQHLRRAAELSPPTYLPRVHRLLGQHFRERGHFAEAEKWFRMSIDQAPTDAGAHIYLGAMLARLGRLDEAETHHRRGTACLTGAVDEAYLNLGLVLRAMERYVEALECFELALEMDPQYEDVPDASRDVVNAMEARRRREGPVGDDRSDDLSERWDENMAIGTTGAHAVEAWRTFVLDFPRDGYGLAMLGMNLVTMSKFHEAEDVLMRSLVWTPPKHQSCAFLELGEMRRHRGQFSSAETWYRRVIDGWPFRAEGYTYLGQMFRGFGRLKEAEQAYRQATACEPESRGEAYKNLALVLRSQGRYSEALECFELARGFDPDDRSIQDASRDVVNAMRVRGERTST